MKLRVAPDCVAGIALTAVLLAGLLAGCSDEGAKGTVRSPSSVPAGGPSKAENASKNPVPEPPTRVTRRHWAVLASKAIRDRGYQRSLDRQTGR